LHLACRLAPNLLVAINGWVNGWVNGWDQPEDEERASDAGFDHHRTKPVNDRQRGRPTDT